MNKLRSFSLLALALSTTAVFAEGMVEQNSRVHFGGVMGGVINVFGGRATREGITSSTSVKGNRKLTVTDRSGELVDLDAEKVYRIDYDRKTYTVKTFDEMRKEYEDAKKRAAEQSSKDEQAEKKPEGPEYVVDFDVKDTGKKETINGYDTHEVITTITVHEKGKKLEQSGGSVLTADMWIGPHIAAFKEVADFDRRFFQKVYGNAAAEFGQQMAVMLATNPTFAKAMKAFGEKRSSFEGTPIRTNLTFEGVAAPGQQAQNDDSSGAGGAGGLGGLIGRAMKRRQASSEGEGAGRAKLFDSTSEIVKASTTAGDVSLPAGFKQK